VRVCVCVCVCMYGWVPEMSTVSTAALHGHEEHALGLPIVPAAVTAAPPQRGHDVTDARWPRTKRRTFARPL
jgi:hypothetical protein